MNYGNDALQNAIRINHRGFLPHSQKRFIFTENDAKCDEFTLFSVDDVKEIPVLTKKMSRAVENGREIYVGDFSEITESGDYFIKIGEKSSRQFVICEQAYDICQRVMLEYFTYQRCGHALGWAGKCHLDDGYIKETGERVDLSGGYHQSCDLRKSPGGVSIGVLSMLRFAVSDRSDWGEIRVRDEVAWACDYYVKTIQENGVMYNTLNDPLGWNGRIFYKSGAPSSAQWNVTAILALGYEYFKERDAKRAKKYLDASLRSFEYMTSSARPSEVYKHPDRYQVGMDPDFFYDQCFTDSSADLAYQITVGATLYRVAGLEKGLELVKRATPLLLDTVEGSTVWRNDNRKKTVLASCSYCWLMGGLLALCDAYELLGNEFGLKDALTKALDEICDFASKDSWRIVQKTFSDGDLDVVDGHEGKTRRQAIRNLVKAKNGLYYSENEIFEPTVACYFGIVLARGARLLENERYLGYAQSVADNLLGANPLDSSHVRGIGYNHAQHMSYGQFFPSTPFIPGAVGVGYSSLDTYSITSEYDMPCVGLSMYLLSLL